VKSSLAPDSALVAVDTLPEPALRLGGTEGCACADEGVRDAGRRHFLPRRVIVQTGLVLLGASVLVATLAIFALELLLSLPVDLARWALDAGPGVAGWSLAHLLQLLKASALCGLVVAPVGGVLFWLDLRRQRWL